MFNWDEFLGGKIAILCKNEAHAEMLLKYLDKEQQITWADKAGLLGVNEWHHHKEETCYYMDEEGLEFGSLGFINLPRMNEFIICDFNSRMLNK